MQVMGLDAVAPSGDHYLVQLGTAIRSARTALGMSQQVLGDAVGGRGSQISRIESGQVENVSVEMVRSIEDAIGLDRGQLLRSGGYVSDNCPPARQTLITDPELDDEGRFAVLRVS